MLIRDLFRQMGGPPAPRERALGAREVALPPDVLTSIDAAAARIGCSPTWLCRTALAALLEELGESDLERRDAVLEELREQYRRGTNPLC